MAEQEPKQLFSNVMFALQDAGVMNDANVMPVLEKATDYLKQAILASNPQTRLYFIDSTTYQKADIALSDIAKDENGLPLFLSTIGVDQYEGYFVPYTLFSWKTVDGREYTAVYPQLAFYAPKEKKAKK